MADTQAAFLDAASTALHLYLRTRVVELVIHTDDLAVSLAGPRGQRRRRHGGGYWRACLS
jgi:hypothetical protein